MFSFALVLMGLSIKAQTIMNIYQNNGTVLQIPLSSIDSITYTANNPGNLATLTTLPIINITANSGMSGGNITNGGGTPVTQKGVCWSTTSNPTTANNTTNDGGGVGSYGSNLIGLVAGSTYFVRAYAINSSGTAYGNELVFTTDASGTPLYAMGAGVTDLDGNAYTTIVLNNGQEWMSENLRTTMYANGDPIPNITDYTIWGQLTSGAWAHFDNDIQYENPYGKLYNWYAAADERNVCPSGWHVPSDDELTTLTDYLGGELVAGGKMKLVGTQYWIPPNQGATNESGFSALPGGSFSMFGSNNLGSNGPLWTATELDSTQAWERFLGTTLVNIQRGAVVKTNGYSIRCLRD